MNRAFENLSCIVLLVFAIGLTVGCQTATAPGLATELDGSVWEFRQNGDATSGRAPIRVVLHAGGVCEFQDQEYNSTGNWEYDGKQLVFDVNDYTIFQLQVRGHSAEGMWMRLRGPQKGMAHRSLLKRIR